MSSVKNPYVPYPDAKRYVVEYLEMVRTVACHGPKMQRSELPYRGISDVVLRHGRAFQPGPKKLPHGLRRGAMKECFMNAQRTLSTTSARDGFTYVEGYALSIIPIHHGWLVDAEGTVLDLTWREPGSVYIGIPFRRDYVLDIVRATGHWTAMLDNWYCTPPQPIITGAHSPDQWLLESFTHGEAL